MLSEALVCWKCGASLEELPLPLARLAECPACTAEVHVCRMCEFYDTRVANSCREPVADEVKDKERANFCDYFTPRPDVFVARDDSEAEAARGQLEALFGATPEEGADAEVDSPADEAREKLEQLFPQDDT